MLAVLVLLTLLSLQAPTCSPAGTTALREAEIHLRRLETAGALPGLDDAAAQGCQDAETVALFLRGLTAARRAYASGGSTESLEPVMRAADALEQQVRTGRRIAELARATLMAAAAAAQSEREDMTTWLEQAASIEQSMPEGAARLIDLPVVTGDLWLQVHRFELARAAYRTASGRETTIASAVGLARVARRLNDEADACGAYRDVARLAADLPADAPVAVEARAFIAGSGCAAR